MSFWIGLGLVVAIIGVIYWIAAGIMRAMDEAEDYSEREEL